MAAPSQIIGIPPIPGVDVQVQKECPVFVNAVPGDTIQTVLERYAEKTDSLFVLDFWQFPGAFYIKSIGIKSAPPGCFWETIVDGIRVSAVDLATLKPGDEKVVIDTSWIPVGAANKLADKSKEKRKRIGMVTLQVHQQKAKNVCLFEGDTVIDVLKTRYTHQEESFSILYHGPFGEYQLDSIEGDAASALQAWFTNVNGYQVGSLNYKPRPGDTITFVKVYIGILPPHLPHNSIK